MNREEFLSRLASALHHIPDEERKDILADFEEHFSLALAEGKNESIIAEELGDPDVIAKELLIDYRIGKAENEQSVKHIVQVILATLSLSFFNLIFIVGPVAVILSLYLGAGVAALAFSIAPLAWLLSILFEPTNIVYTFFVSLVYCGFGILVSIGLFYIGKYLYRLILKYIKFNLRIVKGGN